METFGFILGAAGIVFGLHACAQVEALKKELAELKPSLGRSDAQGPRDAEETKN